MLHYRDRSALVRVVAAGERGADEFSSGEMIELPRLADYPTPPERTVFAFRIGEDDFFLALDEDVAAPAGFTYERVGWLRGVGPADLAFAAAVGSQLASWYRDEQVLLALRACYGACTAQPRDRVPQLREDRLPQESSRA